MDPNNAPQVTTSLPQEVQPSAPASTQNSEPVNHKDNRKILVLLIILLIFGLFTLVHYLINRKTDDGTPVGNGVISPQNLNLEFEKFKDAEELQRYLNESLNLQSSFSTSSRGIGMQPLALEGDLMAPGIGSAGADNIQRVSDTNVQVAGIDEADIVKTDGKNIFYSSEAYEIYPVEPFPIEDRIGTILPPNSNTSKTRIISALPPQNIGEIANLPENGEMLLHNDTLIVFAGDRIIGYDVTNPSSPRELWKSQIENSNQITTSRLFNGHLYLVTNSSPKRSDPCPIPLLEGSSDLTINCTDIYRPSIPMPADTVFTVSKIDPINGEVKDRTSFVGSLNTTVVYMSPNAMYVSFDLPVELLDIMLDFFVNEAEDLLPPELIDQLKKINSYDISSAAKMLEFERLISLYEEQLEENDFDKIMEERMENYMKRRARDLSSTGIVKVDINDFDIDATSVVPGALLNQFALDEHQGNLRVATTVGQQSWNTQLNENDLYVLDENLKIISSIKGMGKGEKIYSVRFVGDKGYLVTFRQIDPFYVVDLSDPQNPQIKGELKIPGFSSYLHPIGDNKVLGVGEENGQVKLSLFNVENPSNPIEVSKYQLNDYWSEVSNNHHAFLLDPEHQVFFIPGSGKGYVFSYSQDVLSQVAELSDIQAQRALYINDYLYIVGRDKIVVLDENTWTEVGRLTFN